MFSEGCQLIRALRTVLNAGLAVIGPILLYCNVTFLCKNLLTCLQENREKLSQQAEHDSIHSYRVRTRIWTLTNLC